MTDKEMMKILDLTPEELTKLKAYDKAVDKGAEPIPLTTDQKKVEKKMRQADRKPTAYKFTPRERKPNEDKRMIIGVIDNALKHWFMSDEYSTFNACTNIEITNAEREINFVFGGKKYKIVLSAPRT